MSILDVSRNQVSEISIFLFLLQGVYFSQCCIHRKPRNIKLQKREGNAQTTFVKIFMETGRKWKTCYQLLNKWSFWQGSLRSSLPLYLPCFSYGLKRQSNSVVKKRLLEKDRYGCDTRSCFLLSVKTWASDNLFDTWFPSLSNRNKMILIY